MRVAALKGLFERKADTPRRFRHEIYAYIAEHEPDAWKLCGTEEQRMKAIAPPEKGQRVHPTIVTCWDCALATAFDGFKFHHQPAPTSIPQGYSTTDLSSR